MSGKTSGSTGHSQGRTGGSRKAPRGSRAPFHPEQVTEPPPAYLSERRRERSARDLTGKQRAKVRRRPVAGLGLRKQVMR